MFTYDPTAYRTYFEREFTYLAGFRRNTRRYADRTAMTDPVTGDRWTYAELGHRVDALAAGLAAAGVRPGDVVVHQLFNGPEFAQLYLATQACGAVGAPVNFRLAAGETAHVLDDSRPTVFVYDTELSDMVAAALERARHRPAVIAAVGPGAPLPGAVPFEELVTPGKPVPEPTRTVYDETTRLYTSGTTGMPKGVPLNSMVEIFSAHDVIMHFPLSPEDRTLNMTPWFHRGGLYSGGPNPAFYLGAEVVPMRAFDPDRCLDLVAEHGLTYLIGAPTNLAMLARAQSDRPRDLSALRGIVTMGAPLEREACLHYQELLTPRIFNGYGTTETFWNTFLRPVDLPDHAGAAGRASTDDDVRVVQVHDDRPGRPDERVAQDSTEIGEVIVRSPKAGYAYVNSPAQEAEKFHDGWVHLGDLAVWDAQEYVTIVGRKDDMLISGGENVHPVQVEEALNEHPGIADSLVIGVPDQRWGQRVVAYVIRTDPSLSAADCEEHCRAHPMLAPYKRPRAYRFVDEFPRTATGKKIHYRARTQAVEDDAQGLFETPLTHRPTPEEHDPAMNFSDYQQLDFERQDNGVLLITINRPDKYNATDEQLHGELARVWSDVSTDPETRVAVITGAGKAFSAGGDLAMVERLAGDHERVSHMLTEMSDLVYNIINCEKPIVSAINGVAVGAGVVIALLADIAICAEDAKLGDGHVKLGVSAGDHAAIIWPLLAGMAKARYYLLTGEMLTGAEAERIGMVAKALPRDQVLDESLRVAQTLATGSQQAIRLTKRSLNSWLRTAGPTFDASAAYEMLCFMGPDVVEGAAALREKREPRFPSAAAKP